MGKVKINNCLAMLNSDDAYKREEGITSLVQFGSEAVESLITALESGSSFYQKASAATALGEIRDIRALDPLIKSLYDLHPTVQEHAAAALGRLGDKRALEPLKQIINNTNLPDVREVAVWALGQLLTQDAIPTLISLLGDDNVNVRDQALEVLTNIVIEDVDVLITALNNSKAFIRAGSAEILGSLQNKKAVEELVKLLDDKELFVINAAIAALAQIRDNRAIEPLIEALSQNNDLIRVNAAIALGWLGDQSVIQELKKLLSDSSFEVRKAASNALQKLESGNQ